MSVVIAIIIGAVVVSFWLAAICTKLDKIHGVLFSIGSMLHAATTKEETEDEVNS